MLLTKTSGIKQNLKRQYKKCQEELKSHVFWRDVVAEAVATFCLMSVQCALPLPWGREEVFGEQIQVSAGMACIVMAMIQTFGPLGGAHMNPAVTIAFWVAQRITILRGNILKTNSSYHLAFVLLIND